MNTSRRDPRAPDMCRFLPPLIAAVCALATSAASAQGLAGALIGTVRDPQGGVVAGAAVEVSSPALIGGPAATSTNERGQWRFPVLPAGDYTIQITTAGFAPHREEDIELGAGVTPDSTLMIEGHAAGPISGTRIEMPVNGSFRFCPKTRGDSDAPECSVPAVSCRSTNHKLALTPQ